MLVVFSIHTYIDIRTISDELIEHVYTSAEQASDIIVRSTRYGMLLNRKADVHQIIRTIGNEPGFVEINIYNKLGEVIFSTDSLSIGETVDLHAEACIACHVSGKPLSSVPSEKRVRVYAPGEDGRILGLINPIRNEAECTNSSCHAHPADQTVLGVLDVKMSLAAVDRTVASTRSKLVASAIALSLLIATVSGMFIYRVVRQPIRRLTDGMQTIAAGNLDARIEMDSRDELGQLAGTFNRMAGDLKTARDELREWGETLEERIERKTNELQLAQNQVIHMEKMASLGKLSASVAHEINNPLFSILTYAKLILRGIEGNGKSEETIRQYATVIQDESSRCGEIVRGLLDFARQTGGQFEKCHIGDIIEKTLVVISHHLEMRQISVVKELTAADDELMCDARQIQQAIIAPCINAVEAMSEGGTLTLRTVGDEKSIAVEITDTGVGIPPEAIDRIFEPFFTTKEGEAGLGLGLAVAYGIVQRHQGTIDVASERDKGTTITIKLPREPVLEEQDVSV